jgi:hypothetical protein
MGSLGDLIAGGSGELEAALKDMAWAQSRALGVGRGALHYTCIYGTLGQEGFGIGSGSVQQESGWHGWALDGMRGGGMRWWGQRDRAATATLRGLRRWHFDAGHKLQPHSSHKQSMHARKQETPSRSSIDQTPKRSALISILPVMMSGADGARYF